MKKPSDFTEFPSDSIFRNREREVIAKNIMVILKRTGNEFRDLSWGEYKKERAKDNGFTPKEEGYFNDVIIYLKSAETARGFSKKWNK